MCTGGNCFEFASLVDLGPVPCLCVTEHLVVFEGRCQMPLRIAHNRVCDALSTETLDYDRKVELILTLCKSASARTIACILRRGCRHFKR